MMQQLIRAGRVLLVAGVVFAQGAWAQSQTPLNGLRADADVLTAPTLVPSILASNELDAAFMQGYLHARDRLFQMDFNRRIASGTLAELVGAAALPTDIQLRTLGIRRAAWQSFAVSSSTTRAVLRAYANGVNASLAANPLPPEYGALELSTAEPWSPVDSLAIGKLLAFDLSDDLGELDLTVNIGTYQAVGEVVGFDGTALFFEDTHRVAPADDRVTVPGFLASIGGLGKSLNAAPQFKLAPEQVQLATSLRDKYRGIPVLNEMMSEVAEKGSNFWIVSGDVTDSGAPILANDPHLSLETPSVWYPVHVNVSDESGVIQNTSGVGFPGAPIIAQGCTDTLCWGSTVNPIDEMDFFFEEIRVNNLGLPTHTIYQGEQEPLIWVYQSYFANQLDGTMDNVERQNVGVDGGAITFIVPRRNNGPIVDLTDDGRAISVQYTGWGPTLEIEAFLEMAKAADIDDFRQAVSKFDFGSQNFAVADTSGNIAYFAGGEMPVRSDLQKLGQPDGGIPPVFIRDGTGALMHEWLPVENPQPNQSVPYEILPAEEMPQLVNPESGYIANGNNDPVGTSLDNNPLNQLRPGGGLYYLSQGGYPAYRMGRIDRMLQDAIAAGPVSAAQIKAMQANNQMLDAELVLPHLLNAFDNAAAEDAWPGIAQFAADPQIAEAMSLLAGWDFSTPTGLQGGYDPGDNAFALQPPSDAEVASSIAATVFSVWRGQVIGNTIDATLSAIGLGDNLPSSRFAYNALKHHLDNFDSNQGVGASGINFFTNPEAPTAADARDFALLGSLRQGLDLLASDAFAPAFGNSTDLDDYRWGKLHRIAFSHKLNDVFTLPNGLYGLATQEGLPGVARAGGYEVVDASSHNARADGLNEFMFGSGPSRRFVGTMAPGAPVYEQVIAGGQSGVIGEASYANQLYFWLGNAYLPLFIDPGVVGAIAEDQQSFGPDN